MTPVVAPGVLTGLCLLVGFDQWQEIIGKRLKSERDWELPLLPQALCLGVSALLFLSGTPPGLCLWLGCYTLLPLVPLGQGVRRGFAVAGLNTLFGSRRPTLSL